MGDGQTTDEIDTLSSDDGEQRLGVRGSEICSHFECPRCRGSFFIRDAPLDRTEWYCPWCGTESPYVEVLAP